MKQLVRFLTLFAILLAAGGAAILPATAAPQSPKKAPPLVREAAAADTLPSLAQVAPEPLTPVDEAQVTELPRGRTIRPAAPPPKLPPGAGSRTEGIPSDSGVASQPGQPQTPAPVVDVEGQSRLSCAGPYLPPDTNGAAGHDHYIQLVNICFAIYNKAGSLVFGPAKTHTLWNNFGAPCGTLDGGDGIVLYDRYASRFLVSQLQYPNGVGRGPFYECIAVSVTANPLGAWNRYAFVLSNDYFQDYPKIGVWPDGYYLTTTQYFVHPNGDTDWKGGGVFVLERDKMLMGKRNARSVYFDMSQPGYDISDGLFLPSDLEGPILPAAGSPNFLVNLKNVVLGTPDGGTYPLPALHVSQVHVDWNLPGNSTFAGPQEIATADFAPFFNPALCSDGTAVYPSLCIRQPGTTQALDALPDRLMMRLQYRNFGDHATLVTNHTVDVDGAINRAGIRWYELWQQPGQADWSIHQQGTFAPQGDQNSRWMASIAEDANQNIALGYTIINSATNLYASINYTARTADDPLGSMPQGEVRLVTGAGYQSHPSGRWGDYSDMLLDPMDDCTFWYTTQYNLVTSAANWTTRIGAFRFPDCGSMGTR